ncbi:PAX-interacting protein 1 [Phytophthora nicotianae]|uniref:PAX-interacting protein 1 n=1 Tax=Phytophthora nicotianae TaxID=4792 RepID=A0A0W8DI59_PHYNI|nr:PAX-interacting protein 1 [Phytophthora nicotianae]
MLPYICYYRLGNEEFNEKNFDKAIECYSEAIRLGPDNHVYYSNRSAAYGAVGKWELAEKDAQECVKRNPKFAKGYHRLANAQQQLGRKKEAIETLKTAQTTATDTDKVPGIKKLLRQLNQEVAPKSAASTQGGGRQVPMHVAKELQELQPQFQKIQQASGSRRARGGRPAEGTKTYRSIGKMFLQTDSEENVATLKNDEKHVDEQVSSLEARKNYLNRQKQSVQDNITELLAQCT